MFKHSLLLGAALLGLSAAAAHANPVSIAFQRAKDAAPTLLATGDGSAGVQGYTVSNNTNSAVYTINLSATGSPTLTAPNFSSNTLTVRSSGSGTITLMATETDLTTPVPFFTSFFSNNGGSDFSVTESSYVSASNTAFALDTLIGTATLAPEGKVTVQSVTGAPSAKYSLTEIYTVTFGTTGQVDATIIEKATAAAVPEPVSLSVLGAGLAGLGLVRRRKRG